MARHRWLSFDYSTTFCYILAEATATVGRARTADAGHAMSSAGKSAAASASIIPGSMII